ncbi:helix-turn-helix transcriptional regulator [Candidatus Roizmanbacteria bacterium]|nr:MAG: helix-turn-helix transcriptional regulator [Candidatus Roizmanbacteria bacterium]
MGSQEQLAKILKNARIKANMTQAQVAEKADIHVNYYARIERGEVNPTVDVVDSIAKALKIKLKFPLENR